MLEKIAQLKAEIENYPIENEASLESFRIRFLSKKSELQTLFDDFKQINDPGLKPILGKSLNEVKKQAEAKFQTVKDSIQPKSTEKVPFDPTLPAYPFGQGSRHPLKLIQKKIIDIFTRIGFTVADGPEMEDDWHNFSALNFEENHPARDMQDTFFIGNTPDKLLRTHTTNIQIHIFEQLKNPPFRFLMPGRVYRNEAISARAHCFFHQIDGVAVEKGISFADMKQTLLYFAQSLFGKDVQLRMRPSYFPFTEISAEVDVSCYICKGAGCQLCKHTGWVEILGCGMIDPNVFKNTNIDSNIYSGYAWGMGVERIAQLLLRVPDLRLYSQNDIRFLAQF